MLQESLQPLLTDMRTVASAGVFADVPAVSQRSGPSGVGRGAQEPDGAEDPAGSHGHHPGTGL